MVKDNVVRPAAFDFGGAPVPETLASAFAEMAPRHLREDAWERGLKAASEHPDLLAAAWARVSRDCMDAFPDQRPDQIDAARFLPALYHEFVDLLHGAGEALPAFTVTRP